MRCIIKTSINLGVKIMIYMTTLELAEKLNVHRVTIMRMAKDGRIPYIRISPTEFRYDFEKVMEALQPAE